MTNQILARMTKGAPEPEVGMGATILMHSDRHAATIVSVDYFKTGARAGLAKTVMIQRDHAQRIDKNGMGDNQEYIFLPDPTGARRVFTRRKNGSFADAGGTTLAVGYRSEFYDFSM